MSNASDITRVTYRWDDQWGVPSGWYCETFADDRLVDDSMKIWFPVAVDDFGIDEKIGLGESLAAAFGNAEVIYS